MSSFRDRTQQSENQYETFYVLKKDSGFVLELPGGEKGPTSFRVFPAFDEAGKELPARIGRDDGFGNVFFADRDFTPWIYPEIGVRRAGSKGDFTAFFRLPGKDDRDPSPLHVFWKTMRKAIWNDKDNGGSRKFPAEWYNWIGSKTDKKIQMEAALKRPGWLPMFQGICYGNRGKEYKDHANAPAPKYPALYLGTSTVMTSFEKLLDQKRPGVKRATKIEDFLIPDLLSCAGGFQLDIALGEAAGIKGYEIKPGAAAPLDVAWTRAQRKPWDEVFRLLNETEQVELLCAHFERESVDFALRGSPYEALLSSDVLGSWDRMGKTTHSPAPAPAAPPAPPANVPPPPQTTPATPAAPVAPAAGVVPSPAPAAPPAPPPQAAPAGAPPAPAPFAGTTAQPATTTVDAPFNPSAPPPPPTEQATPQPATQPVGDASTDLKSMGSVRERLAAATESLSEPGAAPTK